MGMQHPQTMSAQKQRPAIISRHGWAVCRAGRSQAGSQVQCVLVIGTPGGGDRCRVRLSCVPRPYVVSPRSQGLPPRH
jgi:hypothetical protein